MIRCGIYTMPITLCRRFADRYLHGRIRGNDHGVGGRRLRWRHDHRAQRGSQSAQGAARRDDAPEKRQDFGSRSKQSLSGMAYRQQAMVETNKKDRYGRLVGKVIIDGRDVNRTGAQGPTSASRPQMTVRPMPQPRTQPGRPGRACGSCLTLSRCGRSGAAMAGLRGLLQPWSNERMKPHSISQCLTR